MSAALSEIDQTVTPGAPARHTSQDGCATPAGQATRVETMVAAATLRAGALRQPTARDAAGSRPPTTERGSRRPPRRSPSTPPAQIRARLLPSATPAPPTGAEGPAHRVPATVRDRIEVMRATDRSLVIECADEDRGEIPVADPALVVRRLALGAVEVIVGRRPAAQLARWLTPGVLHALRTRTDLRRRAAAGTPSSTPGARPPAVRRAYVCPLDPRVIEASVVIDDGYRVRAVALRLETHRGAWRATALDIG